MQLLIQYLKINLEKLNTEFNTKTNTKSIGFKFTNYILV